MSNLTGIDAFCGELFWAPNTLSLATPELSQCFQHTLCVWIPCIFLFLASPYALYRALTSKRLAIGVGLLSGLRLIGIAVLIVLIAVVFVSSIVQNGDGRHSAGVWLVYPIMLEAAFMDAFILSVLNLRHGQIYSGALFIFWVLLAVLGVPEFTWWILNYSAGVDDTRFYCYMIYYPIVLLEFLLNCFADSAPPEDRAFRESFKTNVGRTPCPEYESSFLNQLTFWWFTSMTVHAYRKPLENGDLWSLNTRDATKSIISDFTREWEPACQQYYEAKHDEQGKGTTKKPSLVWAIAKMSRSTLIPAVLIKVTNDLLQFVNPIILQKLIQFVEDQNLPTWLGYFWSASFLVVALCSSFLLHQYFHRVMTLGMNWRTALTAAVFNKSLKLSNSARKGTTVGEIVNLMAVDANKFQQIASYVSMTISGPLQMALSLYFLWVQLGVATLAGVAVLAVMLPLNLLMTNKMEKWQVKQMKYKDERIKQMNEILSGMKVLKLYAWEKSFEQQVLEIRQKELVELRKIDIMQCVTNFMWQTAPFLVAVSAFGTFVLIDPVNNILTPQKAFVSLSLLNILQFSMTVLPMIISNLIQVRVSNRRLQRFLTSEELNPNLVTHGGKNGKKSTAAGKKPLPEAIAIRDGTFSWDRIDEDAEQKGRQQDAEPFKPTLRSINFKAPQGRLIAVVGSVGSGKSSLISAMMGEMEKLEGFVGVNGSVAYVPQQAWIQNMTLRDNILFGTPYSKSFYNKTIEACSLKSDLEILTGGDQTEIGEKGINLSGGQKQRVSLARAVYSRRDIYLFDDPLSAVDSHVGKAIFDNVIGNEGMLNDKTRILVTHGLHYLKFCDEIVCLTDGEISEEGTYEALLAQNGAFAEFLQNNLLEAAENEEAMEEADDILEALAEHDPRGAARLKKQISVISAGSGPSVGSDEDGRDENENDDFGSLHSIHSGTASSPKPQHRRSHKKRAALHRQTSHDFGGSFDGGDGEQQHDDGIRRRTDTNVSRLSNGMIPMTVLNGGLVEDDGKVDEGDKNDGDDGTKLVQAETAETGHVQFSVYIMYFKAIGLIACAIFFFGYAGSAGLSVGSNIWLADWSNDAEINGSDKYTVGDRIGVYAALGVSQGISMLIATGTMALGMVTASRVLHWHLLSNLLRAPMAFFDVTPIGRIINRFGKDIDVLDSVLPLVVQQWVVCFFTVLSTLVVNIVATPIFAAVIAPLAVVYYFVLRFYVMTSRQLKRLESVSRSPIYSHFQEAVQGCASIRAYGVQKRFEKEAQEKLDLNLLCYYPNVTSNRWLAVRLEFIGNLIVFFAALFAVLARGSSGISAGLVGLSVSYALQVTNTLNWLVRVTSELETNVVSVERIKEYADTEREADWDTKDPAKKPKASWPADGHVTFKGYATRYRKGLDLVIRGITADVESGEKVGIVGRTGAGKSSLTLALFRIIEAAEGRILIDGVDIAELGLHDLRSKLTIIPQDPVLFSGTLRLNLDPFNTNTDEELWTALEDSGLKEFVAGTALKLQYPVAEGGENLSVGQRQLVCLARALLRHTKILILDEATAAVDFETDSLIQQTIRAKFSTATILTIAHRLNTILDYDKVMVLDKGEISEFASPTELLANPKSEFYSMAKDANIV